jgi:hypothetical protein
MRRRAVRLGSAIAKTVWACPQNTSADQKAGITGLKRAHLRHVTPPLTHPHRKHTLPRALRWGNAMHHIDRYGGQSEACDGKMHQC